ncbi:MAG: hypothetical protein L6R38_002226 [Xanthoria sp. 2 TBL-2021]|nr:MAG: hypothetical protein L6R38_002226 [Xanthoria sp. 2 TBL-2021]
MASQYVPSRFEIFQQVKYQIFEKLDIGNESITATKRLLDKSRQDYPTVTKLTYHNYVEYWGNKTMEDIDRERQAIPVYEASKLWEELQYHPLEDRNDAEWMANFLGHSYFPRIIDLGKLDGRTPIRVAPRNYSFEDDTIICPDGHEAVSTGVLAVGYHHRCDAWSTQSGTIDGGVLRRFKEVGSILMEDMNGWNRTGHVLVIDMDKGRNRQPWIILASAWEVDDGYSSDTVRAPLTVSRNDTRAFGVFPRHNERTTIARINAQPGKSNTSTPLLLQFGPNFSFDLDECGTNDTTETSKGPELARVMPWVRRRDRSDCQEMCYLDDDGMEVYMRYDARDQKVSYGFKEQARLA